MKEKEIREEMKKGFIPVFLYFPIFIWLGIVSIVSLITKIIFKYVGSEACIEWIEKACGEGEFNNVTYVFYFIIGVIALIISQIILLKHINSSLKELEEETQVKIEEDIKKGLLETKTELLLTQNKLRELKEKTNDS